ncbi:MAG: hypothetical protein ABIS51_21830 [Sphingomonas sp.]
MRLSMIIATAGSLMLSSPAISQKNPSAGPLSTQGDGPMQPLNVPPGVHADSFCLVTLTHYETVYDNIPDAVFDKMTPTDRADRRAMGQSLKRSQSFYLGVVSTLRDDQLASYLTAASKAFSQLPKEQRDAAFGACLQHVLPRVDRVGTVMPDTK